MGFTHNFLFRVPFKCKYIVCKNITISHTLIFSGFSWPTDVKVARVHPASIILFIFDNFANNFVVTRSTDLPKTCSVKKIQVIHLPCAYQTLNQNISKAKAHFEKTY